MVLQLLAATEKTGQLEVRSDDGEQRGFLGVSGGRLVSAQFEDEDGDLALGAVFAIEGGDFEFLPQDRIQRETLSGDVEELLDRAGAERERVRANREVIANDRVRFRLSDRATQRGEITLAPAQWKALLLIDGQRDVSALAEGLGMRRPGAWQLLADLVRAGLADAVAPPAGAVSEGGPRLPPMGPLPPTDAGARVVLRGRLPDFPLETIVQLLAATMQTGRLEVRAGPERSTLGMSGGRLVSATNGEGDGELVLGAAFTAQEGEFDFVPMAEAPAANLSGELDVLLDRAAGVRDRIVAIREVIPNDRARFVLSERATSKGEIVLTPEQWRVLLGVNGERDVVAIAEHVRMRQLPLMMVLADLVRGGYVDVIAPREETLPAVEPITPPWPPPETAAPVAAAPPETLAPAAPAPPETPAPAPPEELARSEAVEAPAPETPLAKTPLAKTPLDREPAVDDRLAALSELFGPAQPAPPPPAWEPPPPEPELPAWATPGWETPAPAVPEAPAPPPAEVDPRLAAFGVPAAQPEAPARERPAPAVPAPVAPEAPVAGPAPAPAAEEDAVTRKIEWPERGPAPEVAAAPTVAPAAPPATKKGLFGGLLGGAKPASVAEAPVARAATRPGQLADLANELITAYNSGRYGKARVEDRMLSLIMRADEQADPIDRPLPITNDRLDVGAIDRDGIPERQALPYLAVLVRQIYDDAERALGKDKARRGFRDVRDRLFGEDLALLHAPEVSGRLPKV